MASDNHTERQPPRGSFGSDARTDNSVEADMRAAIDMMVYEHMLLSRIPLHGVEPYGRQALMDRSAAVLLSRLTAEGPMSVAELAEAFDVDVSTVHRQIASAMKHGLVEKIADPDGGAAKKHQPSPEGAELLEQEFAARRDSAATVMDEWSAEDVATYARMLCRFNQSVEEKRGKPWPRA